MMNTNDAQLVEQCRAGDAEAFGELVRRYQDPVFNLAWRMTGNWHEAADVTQEAFIRAYRKLDSYRPDFLFRNWVMSIGANLAKNLFRSRQRRQRAEDMAARLHETGQKPADPPGGDEELEAALRKLPDTLRAAVVLKHMEGMSYEQIAQVLGIGVSAAKMRVARGRDELVRLLGAEAGERP